MNCSECRWFIDAYIQPSKEQFALMKLWAMFGVMVKPDNRICGLGGCNGKRFERRK